MVPRTTKKPRRRPRTLEPQKVLLIKQALIGCGLVLFLGGILTGIWYGTRLEAVTISEVVVTGGDTVDHELVQQMVESVLVGSYFGLIPKRFTYLYPEQSISQAVLNIDRLAEVTVERSGRTGLTIAIVEHVPTALWCTAGGDDCMFLNAAGIAFAPAPGLTGGSLLRIYDTNSSPRLHQSLYDADQFGHLLDLIKRLESEIGWGANVVVRDAGDRVTIRTVSDAELFVRLEQPVSHTIHYLTSLLGADGYEHLSEQSFAYIDLRFGNRIFVNESLLAETATSAPQSVGAVAGTALDLSEPTVVGGGDVVVNTSATDTTPTSEADVTQTTVVETAVDDETNYEIE